jgi:hypothetical protein
LNAVKNRWGVDFVKGRIDYETKTIDYGYAKSCVEGSVIILIQILTFKHLTRIARSRNQVSFRVETHHEAIGLYDSCSGWKRTTGTNIRIGNDGDGPVRSKSGATQIGKIGDDSKLARVAVNRKEERVRRDHRTWTT